MYFSALATDYDGTLAHDGIVTPATQAALEHLRGSGRKLLLVTGRELPDLRRVFPRIDLFDCVVAENGALLYDPATDEERLLCGAPPEAFVESLRTQGVTPLSAGRVIVATKQPNEECVLKTIREMGLDLQLIRNKGAIMILPSGIDKASGLRAVLAEMQLAPRTVVAVGDAENDLAFMQLCGCSVAVGNALPTVKQRVDYVTAGDRGAGVAELIELLIATDLAELRRSDS